ncbi:unnamed protein product [Nesidiocoris tenuis]|uniref:Uncharacterized protein n=1 Tax=Nesidiocoris tenuis TaxID=355587 RepID=A0A6H5GJQ1_9HEMI|nr:unnamed protein product [Nesidiocoris tenuis]
MVKETAEVTAQYEALKQKVNDTRQNSGVTNTKLQQELNSLKQQHMLLTMEEQEKIKEAEDKSKKLAAAHELRVANLEARLAELSETVGLYDRLRQSDQVAIEKLKVTEGDGVVLHYSEELARRDVELSRLRKEKLKIEAELRDIRREMAQLVAHEQHLTSLLQSQLQRSVASHEFESVLHLKWRFLKNQFFTIS